MSGLWRDRLDPSQRVMAPYRFGLHPAFVPLTPEAETSHRWLKASGDPMLGTRTVTVVINVDEFGRVYVSYEVLSQMLTELGWVEDTDGLP